MDSLRRPLQLTCQAVNPGRGSDRLGDGDLIAGNQRSRQHVRPKDTGKQRITGLERVVSQIRRPGDAHSVRE